MLLVYVTSVCYHQFFYKIFSNSLQLLEQKTNLCTVYPLNNLLWQLMQCFVLKLLFKRKMCSAHDNQLFIED